MMTMLLRQRCRRLLLPLLLLLQLSHSTHAQSISVNRDCLLSGEEFAVTFVNVDPQVDDWIGIVSTSESTAAFTNLGTWVWACGTMDCTSAAASGRVRILAAPDIAAGDWVAVLSRGAVDAPWSAYAVSNVFTVAATSCDGVEAPSGGGTSSATPSGRVVRTHLDEAWGEIESIIDEDFTMAPQFLRMAFHDCVGGCDGCIDLDHHDNAGIAPAINALRPIVARHAIDGLSRADIWALSAVVASDVTQRDNSRIDMDMSWFGRVDCENTGNPCLGPDGTPVVCMDTKGPHRNFPNIHMNTHALYNFFATEFGFSQRDTVVIMGAHTLGVVRKEDFGIDGPNGWVLDNDIFDNGYYKELIGGTSVNDPVEVMVNEAPAWRRIIENGIRFLVGFPSGVRIIMLNTDISLVRNLDDSNFDSTLGRINCAFEDNTSTDTLPVCPHVEGALQAAAEFAHDNLLWLEEYRDVLDRLLTHGYGRPDCDDLACPVAIL